MEPTSINWELETLRIGIPVATTIIVGWWINRSNEKYKSKLARDHFRYQDFYPKMTATIADLYIQLSQVERSLGLAYGVATTDLYKQFPKGEREATFQQTSEVAINLTAQFDAVYAGVRILLDERSRNIFDEILVELANAAKFLRTLSISAYVAMPEGDDIKMWNHINDVLTDRFPKLKKDLENHIHAITQGLTTHDLDRTTK
jgi:hypothetical protein